MNKTCTLNFLNEFRELFDQGSIYIYIYNREKRKKNKKTVEKKY